MAERGAFGRMLEENNLFGSLAPFHTDSFASEHIDWLGAAYRFEQSSLYFCIQGRNAGSG